MAKVTRLAVFDCDGTLSDGQANICRAMALAFAGAGLAAPDVRAVRGSVGLSLPQAVGRLLPDAEPALHDDVAEAYKHHFRAMRSGGTLLDEPLFPGIADAVAVLLARGWTLGIATGKSDRGLAFLLDHHGLGRHFATLQTADRHPSKPHPAMLRAAMAEAGTDPADTVMIGDTSFDMAMAAAAGVRGIGVAWGYHAADALAAAGASCVCADTGELLECLMAS